MKTAEDELTPDSTRDRRKHQRFQFQAPALLMLGTREIAAFTRDLSPIGAQFRVTAGDEPQNGDALDFVVEIPPSVTYPHEGVILGRGRVTRIDHYRNDESAVAVQILNYSVRRDFTFH